VRPAVFALAVALAAGPACRSAQSVDVRIDMPGVSPFPAGSFGTVSVTDFREDEPVEGFAAGRSLRDYLAEEIDRAFEGPVTRTESASEALAAGAKHCLVVTGSVRLATEVRKALDSKRPPVEGPFRSAERGLIEVRRWTMTTDIFILDGTDGTTLLSRAYREERDYTDLEKPAEFAFSELSARVRARLLPVLLGTATIEKRTLIVR
jgi:hypothetical protein